MSYRDNDYVPPEEPKLGWLARHRRLRAKVVAAFGDRRIRLKAWLGWHSDGVSVAAVIAVAAAVVALLCWFSARAEARKAAECRQRGGTMTLCHDEHVTVIMTTGKTFMPVTTTETVCSCTK